MPFLNKLDGVVLGVAAHPQADWSNEEVADDHADIAAYKAAKDARRAPAAAPAITAEQLATALLANGVLTEAQIEAAQGGK